MWNQNLDGIDRRYRLGPGQEPPQPRRVLWRCRIRRASGNSDGVMGRLGQNAASPKATGFVALMLGAALATTGALADVRYADAPVTRVEPIVETVTYVEPKERCWFEDVPARTASHSATTPLVGALIGGAIGNAVGHKKRNKQVGTVVGALIGGSIGADMSRHEARRVVSNRRVRREVCEVVDETSYRREVTGYLVTYEYAGETYEARMRRRPGENVRVRVTVGPA